MEITVTMLVVALLIGITYTAYGIISSSFERFNRKQEEIAVLLTVDGLLKRDIAHAGSVVRDAGGLTFFSSFDTVRYEFRPDEIVRIKTRTDTFRVRPLALRCSFEKEPVEPTGNTGDARIDELTFKLICQETEIPYHYYKSYSASDLVGGAAAP